MCFGQNMSRGFVYVPGFIGLSMQYKATLKPANPRESSFYASLVLRGRAFAHDLFLDGGSFRDSHSVDKETFVGMIIFGLHYAPQNWGIHAGLMESNGGVDANHIKEIKGVRVIGIGIAVYGYVLITNHVHLLMTLEMEQGVR